MGRHDQDSQVRRPKRQHDELIDTIAGLAIRTGIAPQHLLEAPVVFVNRMIELVNEASA